MHLLRLMDVVEPADETTVQTAGVAFSQVARSYLDRLAAATASVFGTSRGWRKPQYLCRVSLATTPQAEVVLEYNVLVRVEVAVVSCIIFNA